MLANDGADVYSIDINSIYLFRGGRLHKCEGETPESCVRKSSVVVTGVPAKAYRLPTDWIQPNTTVVNVASFKNVDEEVLIVASVVFCDTASAAVLTGLRGRKIIGSHPRRKKTGVAGGALPPENAASWARFCSSIRFWW